MIKPLSALLALLCCAALPAQPEAISYPNGAKKAVIFSYDDGPVQDRRLVDLFNKYQVVGTFNLNSGLLGKTAPWMENFLGSPGQYLGIDEIGALYAGHEIAGHSHTHPGLAGLASRELKRQLSLDQQILTPIAGSKLRSFAYPLGSYDQAAMQAVADAGFSNARTVKDSKSFALPAQPLAWHPTVHHSDAISLVKDYLELRPSELTVMMIWGHSWEFDQNKANNNWRYMEQLVRSISGQDDIWYVSAGEFIDFINRQRIQKST